MAYYIEEFEGTFNANAQPSNTSHSDKSGYYPGTQVQIKMTVGQHISKREIDPVPTAIITGKVIAGKDQWDGATGFEKAKFYFYAGILVSDPIQTTLQTAPGEGVLYITETIMLLNNGSMEHQLSWSDGDFGRWGCR